MSGTSIQEPGRSRRTAGTLPRLFLVAALAIAPLAATARAQASTNQQVNALAIARLALDTERSSAIREIKRVEYAHAHFLQHGEWDAAVALYHENASVIAEETRLSGPAAIRQWLIDTLAYGDGAQRARSLHTRLMLQPVITLSDDGLSAIGRWTELTMTGRLNERADWSGGLQVNTYIKEGARWKIAEIRRHLEFAGPYEQGWLSIRDNLALIPYHFLPSQAGRPVSDIPGGTSVAVAKDASEAGAHLAGIEAQIAAMLAEQEVLNLQNIYGYYVDRKMWSDVVDLFESDASFTIEGVGRYSGSDGVRRAMELDGPENLRTGQVNDKMQLHVIVDILPGAMEARARGLQFGMISSKLGVANWALSSFESRFVKRGGKWRIASMHLYPKMQSDYYAGWAESWTGPETKPTASITPRLETIAKNSSNIRSTGNIPARIQASRQALTRSSL